MTDKIIEVELDWREYAKLVSGNCSKHEDIDTLKLRLRIIDMQVLDLGTQQPPPNKKETSDDPPITQQSALPVNQGQVAHEAIGEYLEKLDFRKSEKKIHELAWFRTIKGENGGKAGFFNVFWDKDKGWGTDKWFYEPKPKGTTVKYNAMTADSEWRTIVENVDKIQGEHTIKSG